MKIDTSNVNFSAKQDFFQKQEMVIERELKFSGLFDQQVAHRAQQADFDQFQNINNNGWLSPTRINNMDAVQLSKDFIAELEKLRQILRKVIERVNSTACNCCRLDINRLDINTSGAISSEQFQRQPVFLHQYEYLEKACFSYMEEESTDFFADGVVNTGDGRKIDFSFQMNLDRQYFKQDQFIHKEKGYVMIDPLVINLNTTTPQISDVSINFDLNVDGNKEQIPLLKPGSGFLSLDKNNDGIINDGSELFGSLTGDGFGELSQYDLDHNLWIDENDPIFDELTLWGSDQESQMKLTRIKDAGIGAIYLNSIESPFDLKDENNNLSARIKKSGIALNEDGSVNSIQEIDWTV